MKKIVTIVAALMLVGSVSFAQTATTSTKATHAKTMKAKPGKAMHATSKAKKATPRAVK